MAQSARKGANEMLFSGRSNGPQSGRGPAVGGSAVGSGRPAEPAAAAGTSNIHQQYGLPDEAMDPLQLEHVLGYAGNYRSTVHALPIDDESYIKTYPPPP